MHKKLLISFLILISILANSIICYAVEKENINAESNNRYQVIIEDDANLLTKEEKAILYQDMEKLTEYGNIIFKSINKNPYLSTKTYASKYYHEKFNTQSGTVFLVDMQERYVYIFSDGKNYNTITTNKAEIITDNIYKYATNKQYYKCAQEAYSQIHTLLKGEKIAEPMKYISNAVISIMISLLANFAIFKFATKNKSARHIEHIEECECYLEYTQPEVEQTGEHGVYSPIQTSSGVGRKQWTVAVGGGRK